MVGQTILINVNVGGGSGKPLNKKLASVAEKVAKKINPDGGSNISVMPDGSLPKDVGVAIELFESEGTEPLAVVTRFRVER